MINESEIRRVAASLLSMGPRRGVPCLLRRLLDTKVSDEESETLLQIICAESLSWAADLRRRVKREKRCPRTVRAKIEAVISKGYSSPIAGARLSEIDVLKRNRAAASSKTLWIKDKNELGLGTEFNRLVGDLY